MTKHNTPHKESLWSKLKSYRLHNNIYVLIILSVSVLLSTLIFYWLYMKGDQGFLFNLMIAIATSLMASIFCVISDIYLKYKECENDKFLKGLHAFGINDLHFNKQALLETLLESCHREFWISGYRLILTGRITSDIEAAIARGAKVRILVCPPWNEAFRLVYGENDRVMDNYCKVFHAIYKAAGGAQHIADVCEVHFTSKPLFSDTYKVDEHLITGSYLHNRDEEFHRITANDFFTFDLVRKSELYKLIEEEYLTIWYEAEHYLLWDKFEAAYNEIQGGDLRESEKIALVRSACTSLNKASTEHHSAVQAI